MTVPSLMIALPCVFVVAVLWFWMFSKVMRWVVGPLDARIAALARRIQENER